MRPNLFISAAIACLISACGAPTPDTEARIATEAPRQTLELVTTHDIDVAAKTRIIAFSPNNVASWLGKLALLSEDGALYVSGPEAQTLKRVGENYKDVIGYRRDNAAAVFIALADDGTLQAYLESDDEGNFSPIATIASAPLSLKAFCRGAQSPDGRIFALTTDNQIIGVEFSQTEDEPQFSFGEPDVILETVQPDSTQCAYGNKAYYTLSSENPAQPLTMTLTQYDGADTQSQTIQSSGAPSLAFIEQTAKHGDLLAVNNSNIATLYSGNDLTPISDIAVADGLSISGLETSAGLYSTSSSFGGAGYNEGIVAFPDAEGARIVFVSRSFLLERLEQIGVADMAQDAP